MGLAVDGDRLAIGAGIEIWEYHNVPALARRLEPAGKHDACFLPRSGHLTGNVLIHEMAWHDGELWFVNTRFSCLCTRDRWHSFVPRWRPAFISGLAPEDRCHLNGLGFTPDGRCLVTALGETDSPNGWRADKCHGGILLDAGRGEVLVRDLAMPHSPRAHDGRIWLLESGAGTFGYIDERAGRYEPIAELPGFTRGLDFYGDYAFIGLSQVRESAVFSGLPITERIRGAPLWRLGGRPPLGSDCRVREIRGRPPGDLRRPGCTPVPLPGAVQRRQGGAGRFVRPAGCRPGGRARFVAISVLAPILCLIRSHCTGLWCHENPS